MSLKDLDNVKMASLKSNSFGDGNADSDDEGEKREQYRVIKKDLLFKVNF